MNKNKEQEVAKFINEYLNKREHISLIILILDIRHSPTDLDMIMYRYILSKNLPFVIILNKADKIAKTKIEKRVQYFKEILDISYSPIFPFSSIDKIYTKQIWDLIKEKNTNE